MTKAEMIYPKIGIEPKQFTDTMQERCYPLTVVCDLMDEWAAQEVSKEREKAKKLVEAAKSVMKSWNERMNNEIEEEKENKHGPYKYWSPAASMVASSEINKLRQSLTEYEKL